jgi:hypothetical protein
MQKLSELANRVTHPVLGVASQITHFIPLRAGLLGLWFLVLLNNPVQGFGAAVTTYGAVLTWDRSTSTGVSGYRIYYGTASGSYTNSLAVGNVTNQTILGLAGGVTYFFAVRAYTVSGVESAFSVETRFITGLAKVQGRTLSNRQFILTVNGAIGHTYDIQATQDLKTWSTIGTAALGSDSSLSFTDTNASRFVRRYYRALQTK